MYFLPLTGMCLAILDVIVSTDFYSTILAWSPDAQLAVALRRDVHLWSELSGQDKISGSYINVQSGTEENYANVSALSYSPNNQFLAVARKDGLVQIFARLRDIICGTMNVVGDVACLAFKPNKAGADGTDDTTHLLVGAHLGKIYYLSVQVLPVEGIRNVRVSLLSIISSGHTEQITYVVFVA